MRKIDKEYYQDRIIITFDNNKNQTAVVYFPVVVYGYDKIKKKKRYIFIIIWWNGN